MKTVTSTLVLAILAFAPSVATSAPKVPSARLLDMYAVKEGDNYVVHVLASGDISQFLSDRKNGDGTYRLTLDVPAVSPMSSKFDVQTPFSRQFQVWPMQLGKKIYSRIEIELDLEASSVVGLENASHLFVRIRKELPPGLVVAENASEPSPPSAPVRSTPLGVLPVEPPTADGGSEAAPAPLREGSDIAGPAPLSSAADAGPAEEELFFSLFPTPVRQQQTLFNVAAEDFAIDEGTPAGIRVGRFMVQPSADVSFVRGSNLLLETEEPFVDSALMARGQVTAILLDSNHELALGYEARYRDFKNFTLEEKLTNLFDMSSKLELSPRTSLQLGNHFVRGSFEPQEFDFGGEVVASTDPFFRNYTKAVLGMEFSERFGSEITGTYNLVDFLDDGTEFFDYRTSAFGGTFLYSLSPLTSLLGEYVRETTPEPLERPQASSVADMFLVGLRGELTAYLRGQVRAGFSNQRFELAEVPQDYSGFVADASVTRDFGETAALMGTLGRRTNPSNFDASGYYVSNYFRAQFISPFAQNFRVTASGAMYFNGYPVPDPNGIIRNDDIFSGAVGLAYFFTPFTYLSFDYRHDQRSSNFDRFVYRNDAVQVMVGFGFLNR